MAYNQLIFGTELCHTKVDCVFDEMKVENVKRCTSNGLHKDHFLVLYLLHLTQLLLTNTDTPKHVFAVKICAHRLSTP